MVALKDFGAYYNRQFIQPIGQQRRPENETGSPHNSRKAHREK